MNKKTINLSVLVPAFNEESLLLQSVSTLEKELNSKKIEHELLIIENGSTDDTKNIASQLADKFSNIRLMSLQHPNYGEALKRGIVESKGSIVSIVNVDYWNVDFISSSLSLVDTKKEYDFVVGSKHLSKNADGRGLAKKAISSGFNLLLRILFNFKGTDTHGQKTFRKSLVLPIVKSAVTSDFVFDTELVLRASSLGLRLFELPLQVKEVRPRRYSNLVQITKTIQNVILLYWKLKIKQYEK